MATLLISYIILGSITSVLFTRYWTNESRSTLIGDATSIAKFCSQFTNYDEKDGYSLNIQATSALTDIISENMDADIFVTDQNGKRLLGVYSCSGLDGNSLGNVDQAFVNDAMSGYTEFRSNFGNSYNRDYLTIGVPLVVTDSNGEEHTVGAVFAATVSKSFQNYRQDTVRIFVLAALVTFIVSFFLVWAFTYKMVKPLRQMSAAAKAFGNGDFSIRVPDDRDDEIGELGHAFNNMANSLSDSEGMRRSFIANVSHELKTPMTTIAGFIDGILDGTIPPERQNYYLKIVSDEVKRLSRLVRSMLNLSRIDSGELKINPVNFDLTDTVFQTVLTFEQKIDEKKIEIRNLENAIPMTVYGDQDLLHQVIYNIVENAVKFTNEGGYISFTLADSIDRACLSIENSGMGISAEDLPRVFDRFYKTDKSRSRDKNGLGLGLFLCKTILKLHGGDITVSSVENEYCRFDLYIPKPVNNQKNPDKVINLSDSIDDDIQDVDI